MTTRRQVLRSMKIAALVSAIPVTISAQPDEAATRADDLAKAMGRKFGGNWRVKFDDLGEFVMISKDSATRS